MADTCITTPTFPRQTHNIMSRAFDILIGRLHELYSAESDCAGLPDGDSAFDHWLAEAEAKRQATISAARAVMVMPATDAQSVLYDLAGRLVDLFQSTDASSYAQAASDLLSASPMTDQVMDFQNQVTVLLTLPDYALEADLPSLNTLSLAA
jgi:hypothetical protein